MQLVLKSIGYKSLPLEGVPFDSKQGIVPNAGGRVLTGWLVGLGMCGWMTHCWNCSFGILIARLSNHRIILQQAIAVLPQCPRDAVSIACCPSWLCLMLQLGSVSLPSWLPAYLPAGVGAAPSDVLPGLYVCGWLKRGPTGIIGTNLTDAEDTVNSIAMDEGSFDWSASGRPALQALLQQRDVQVVDWPAWEQLDQKEVAGGHSVGASRVKFTSLDDMLVAAAV